MTEPAPANGGRPIGWFARLMLAATAALFCWALYDRFGAADRSPSATGLIFLSASLLMQTSAEFIRQLLWRRVVLYGSLVPLVAFFVTR